MSAKWKEVAQLRFKGERFRDHALDLSALTQLSQFQKLVAETAKALWRAKNPNQKLPKHFEDRTRLCLRSIREGSAVAPLEVFIDEPEQKELWEPEPVEVEEAIELACDVFDAANRAQALPENLPKNLVPEYLRLGDGLAEGEEVELSTPKRKTCSSVTLKSREHLVEFTESDHEGSVDITGTVLEADVRQRRFQLWLNDKHSVQVSFSEAQEEKVTTALKEHASLKVRVTGCGKISPSGRVLGVNDVQDLNWIRLEEVQELDFDEHARPIEDVIADIVADVPKEEWAKLPKDLGENLDHYLYGAPKK